MWGLAFAGIATLINDPEWKIEESEAKEMSDRLAAASDAFQSDKTSKLVLWIKKHEAPLYFLAGLLVIVAPRLYHTITKANRAKSLQAKNVGVTDDRPTHRAAGPRLVVDTGQGTPGDSPAPVADVPPESRAAALGVADGLSFTGTADNGLAPTGFQARPFNRADLRDFDSGVE